MMKKLLFLALLLCFVRGSTAMAFIDDFDTAHNYLTGGVAGTNWSGILNSGNATALDASITLTGELYFASSGGNWSGSDNTGPFLYKEVTGDFIAEIKTDAANWEDYTCGGLMVRLGDTAAGGAGEDNIIVSYWPCSGWGFDNLLWLTDNGSRWETNVLLNNAPYLRVERKGNEFWLSYSSDGVNWELFPSGAPYVRDDLNVATLQVGVFQSYADWAGQNSYYDYVDLKEQATAFSGTKTVNEEGSTSTTITVNLTGPAPTAQVDIILTEVSEGEPNDLLLNGAQSPLTLSFGIGETQKTFIVQAIDDDLQEGPEKAKITAEVSSTDSSYAGCPGGSITINVIDNEAGLLIDEGDGLYVDEEGTISDSLSIVLSKQPTADVTVTITTDGQINVTSPLIFTSENWNTAHLATVTGVDDAVLETDPHTGTLSFSGSSSDPAYDGVTAFDVEVTIAENECGAWGYSRYDANQDCVVNLGDLAQVASMWMRCTFPHVEGCLDAR
jgi:regulation of enolase protein 1 (concanavalin A-like superfamily)